MGQGVFIGSRGVCSGCLGKGMPVMGPDMLCELWDDAPNPAWGADVGVYPLVTAGCMFSRGNVACTTIWIALSDHQELAIP